MYRRISEVFEFKRPNYLERLEIWRIVTANEAIPCEESIDWESIALQYELTGGFIKNAVIAALLDAVGRNPESPVITQNDIVEGCKKQVRGALQMMEFDERVVPQAPLEELITSDDVKKELEEMVNLEKARGILFGSWGFNDDMRGRQGTTALFWGPSGTGRSRAAEALAFNLGKPLKVVDMPRLLVERKGRRHGSSGGGNTTVREVFQEARLMDAILVLDGFSLQPDSGGSGVADDTCLLNLVVREMTRFPGVVIMMVETSGSLDVFVSRLDKGLLCGLKFLVEFKRPSLSNREKLWEKLMPASVPTAGTLDFASLARSSDDFSHVQIGNAIYRAAASAALRSDAEKRVVSMKDLCKAIEEEKNRGESAVDRYVKSQYL
jgi:SpoVK/Ycf46/Vps4 family AAA+-type ATPase